MSFTVTHLLAKPPAYSELLELAQKNGVQLTGNNQSGVFSAPKVTGTYVFDENGNLRGEATGMGGTGSFEFVSGKAEIRITEKPFLIPESFLKAKLLEGLQAFCANLRPTR